MMELINREDLETIVVDYWGKSNITEWFLKEINSLSSVDWCSKCEMPERSKGKWITEPVIQGGIRETFYHCSNCHYASALLIPGNYCPRCGAKME